MDVFMISLMELTFHTFFPLEIANTFYMNQNLQYFQLHVINSEKILKRYLIDLLHLCLHNLYKKNNYIINKSNLSIT